MKTHKLKITPEHFKAVASGLKKFEVRLNDRNFQVGDCVILREYEPPISDDGVTFRTQGRLTGNFVKTQITYILSDLKYVKEGYIVFSFKSICSNNSPFFF